MAHKNIRGGSGQPTGFQILPTARLLLGLKQTVTRNDAHPYRHTAHMAIAEDVFVNAAPILCILLACQTEKRLTWLYGFGDPALEWKNDTTIFCYQHSVERNIP